MSNLLLSVLTLAGSLRGAVTYYNPDVMEQVYQNRLAWGHVAPCADCAGMIAMADCRHIGRRVYLQRAGRQAEGPFLVTDCGTFHTPGRVAEVDNRTARRWHMRGPLADVRVLFDPPPVRAAPRVQLAGADAMTGNLGKVTRNLPLLGGMSRQ